MGPPLTKCNLCGECCDPVVLPFTKRELAAATTGDAVSEEDRRFILEELEQIPTREGILRANHFNGRLDRVIVHDPETGDVSQPSTPVFYRCPHFDADSRLCTNHDGRPPMCQGFPWYGKDPSPSKFLPLDCSYRIDLIEKPA